MNTLALAGWRVRSSRLLPLAALVGALAAGLLLIAATGVPLARALGAFWEGTGASEYALIGSLARAVPLALVGLGFMLAERASLINVGAEGQICLGGLAATSCALYGGAEGLPGPLAWLVPLLCGALAGAVWAAFAGVLRVRRGSNEVISTLLLSFIALQMVYGAVQSEALLRQPRASASTLPESLELPLRTQLPQLMAAVMPLHIGVLIALLLAALTWLLLTQSALGLRLRAVGLNELASRRAGLAVDRLLVGALGGSGALAGLAGAIMIQGDQHYLTAGFSSGFGFDGLVVGLLARGSVPSALAFALLFGGLRSGGLAMEISAAVPSAIVLVCQGLIVIATAAAAALTGRKA